MKGNKRTVALCTSRVFDPQTHCFIEKLNERVKKHDARLWIYALNADVYWDDEQLSAEADVFDYVRYDYIDILIYMDEKIKSHRIANNIISNALKKKIPVIVIDGNYDNAICVNFDYAKGFEILMNHLIEEHGVDDFHLVSGIKGNTFSDEREEVFKRVLGEHEMPFNEDMISYGGFWATPAREAAERLIREGRLPRAIVCANDIMAINVCDVLRESGIKIPEDVIVTGYDGFDEVYISNPAITTVSCDIGLLADEAGRVIDSILLGNEVTNGEREVIPELVPNESCGCLKCEDRGNKVAVDRFNTTVYRYQDDIRNIHNTTGKMMVADSRDKAIRCIPLDFAKYMFCVVKKEVFCKEKNFFLNNLDEEGYLLVYDSAKQDPDIKPFELGEIAPRLEEMSQAGYPLIFQALDYMGKSFGYACYYYQTYDITEYAKSASVTDMISTGIGGYVNMRYQQYLLTKVEEVYKVDALTGLYNRLAFREAFESMKSNPVNHGHDLTVIMADLNRLKVINDTLGHEAGDKAIAAVATALKESVPNTAACVRFGGDELLAFIPGVCDTDAIRSSINAILAKRSEEEGFGISASCGVYRTVLTPELTFEEALRNVDKQMYIEKEKSRAARS
ncbi:MAG: GGDEF domain-containing protein [Lachnospiraceae bacterium]|nr:GGDEF domain-containing protein [Lachnospiraceae bacterium]